MVNITDFINTMIEYREGYKMKIETADRIYITMLLLCIAVVLCIIFGERAEAQVYHSETYDQAKAMADRLNYNVERQAKINDQLRYEQLKPPAQMQIQVQQLPAYPYANSFGQPVAQAAPVVPAWQAPVFVLPMGAR
jgi:hypothetical protein